MDALEERIKYEEECKNKIKKLEARILNLEEILQAASDHLDYCGYGDTWERECAGTLPVKIEETLNYKQE